MNQQETAKIMAVLKVAYPRYYQNITADESRQTVKLWESMLKDYPYELTAKAVKALIATEKFVPTVADVIEKIQLITTKPAMSEVEAWGYVKKALRNGAYHSKEEFDGLPQEIQTAIGSHNTLKEWAMTDDNSIETVVASNFMRSFRAKQGQTKQFNALPSDVKDFMLLATEKFDMKKVISREVIKSEEG